jgi:hypothetical protein
MGEGSILPGLDKDGPAIATMVAIVVIEPNGTCEILGR